MKLIRITTAIATLIAGTITLPAAQAFTLDSLPDLSGSGLNYEVRNGAATLYGQVDNGPGKLEPRYFFDSEIATEELPEHVYN